MLDYLRQLQLITVRETQSLEYLRNLGMGDRTVLVADPAFALDPEPIDVSAYLPRERGQALVAFNFSPLLDLYLARLSTDTAENLACQCVQAMLESLPVSVALVPHVVCASPIDDDYLMLKRVAARLAAYRDRISLVPPTLKVRATRYFLGQCDAVLAARMHCAISAMSMCVPTICISYSMKSRGVMGDMYRDERWIILLENLSAQAVVDKLRDLLASRSQIVRHLTGQAPVFRDKAMSAGLELKQRLG